MLPFLLLYALPTIIIFTALIEVYKTTGLIDILSDTLHSRLKLFGLTGRDLIQVVMGFGCNVPAIVSTRSCSSCSRGMCISAISFGSACSYQLPATLAIFGVSGFLWLGPVYLITLALTTLIYLRLTKPKSKQTNFVEKARFTQTSLRLPALRAVFSGVYKSLADFILTARQAPRRQRGAPWITPTALTSSSSAVAMRELKPHWPLKQVLSAGLPKARERGLLLMTSSA